MRAALRPWESAQTYLNFAEGEEDSRHFYADEVAAHRIEAIRAAVDPAGLFVANHPINTR